MNHEWCSSSTTVADTSVFLLECLQLQIALQLEIGEKTIYIIPVEIPQEGLDTSILYYKTLFLYKIGGLLKIRGSLFYKIHGLHVKKNIYHYKKVVANVRKLWLRLSGHLLFVEKNPLQKGGVQRLLFVVFWGPDRSIFLNIFFGSKKNPKTHSHESLARSPKLSYMFFGNHSRAQVSCIALLCSSCDPPYI